MQLLWILSSAVEEPFRLPLKHCRGRSIRLVSNLQLWKMTLQHRQNCRRVAEYFNGKTIDKIRSEFITNRQNHFEEGTLTIDRLNMVMRCRKIAEALFLILKAQVVKLIFQMYLEDMKIPEIARALDITGRSNTASPDGKEKRSKEQKISGRIQQFSSVFEEIHSISESVR